MEQSHRVISNSNLIFGLTPVQHRISTIKSFLEDRNELVKSKSRKDELLGILVRIEGEMFENERRRVTEVRLPLLTISTHLFVSSNAN